MLLCFTYFFSRLTKDGLKDFREGVSEGGMRLLLQLSICFTPNSTFLGSDGIAGRKKLQFVHTTRLSMY